METKNPLISIIKKSLPATVAISVSQDANNIDEKSLAKILDVPIPKTKKIKLFKSYQDQNGMIQIGSGTGFIVDKTGIVVSNRHIVSNTSNQYIITTNDNKKYTAQIVARDPITDIAILKINDHDQFPTLKLGNSNKLELGQDVLAIGNALGLFQNTVSSGIISGLSRSISAQIDEQSQMQEIHGLIQTDAAINPGNSGGPLINLKGEVIGINMAIISGAQNIGFALPINTVKRDLEDIKKYGRIRRVFLGVHYLLIDDLIQTKYNLPVDQGAYVMSEKPYTAESVIKKSPAYMAGIKDKDIILECADQKVCRERTISDILEDHSVGDNISIKILRKGKEFDAKIKLSERVQ